MSPAAALARLVGGEVTDLRRLSAEAEHDAVTARLEVANPRYLAAPA